MCFEAMRPTKRMREVLSVRSLWIPGCNTADSPTVDERFVIED